MNQGVDVAIIGYGFSGGLVLAQLIAKARHPLCIRIFDDSPHAMRGLAYATRQPCHVLNVRAGNMGAWAEYPQHFYAWLQRYYPHYGADDFVPRLIYGEYLEHIQAQALALAQQKNIVVQQVAQHITDLAQVKARAVVLACGNRFDAPSPDAPSRMPWFEDFQNLKAATRVVIIGSGLTAMDSILSLYAAGFAGEIICLSRHGWVPQPHADGVSPYDLAPHLKRLMRGSLVKRLAYFKQLLRQALQWRGVIDALRPHTPALWQSLSLRDQQRFMARLFTLWNMHRHRIDAALHAQILAMPNLQMVCGDVLRATHAHVMYRSHYQEHVLAADMVLDCRGPSYRRLPECAALAVQHGQLQAHQVAGLVATDGAFRVSTEGAPPIYAMGALLLGERFETGAVPELRAQAEAIAEEILRQLS